VCCWTECGVDNCIKCHRRDAKKCLKCEDGYSKTASDECAGKMIFLQVYSQFIVDL